MSKEELINEWHLWRQKVKTTADAWVAETADGFRCGCEQEMKSRGIPIPDKE